MKNLGVLGPMGGGKGSAAKYIAEKYGYKVITMGNIVRALARKDGVRPTRLHLEKIQRKYRQKYGDDFIIKETIRKAESSSKPVILDGVRSSIDARIAKKELGIKIILIDADPEIRFERLKRRRRADFPRTFEEFKKIEGSENKTFHMHKTFRYADYKVDNSDGKAKMRKDLDAVIKKINR